MPAEVVYRKSCLEKFRNTEKKTPVKKRLQHRCIPVNIGKFNFWRTSAYGCFWSDFRKWLFGIFFLESRFQNHPDLVILQKYQLLSNKSFKYNLAHVPSLNLTPTLSFEPRFCIFIINGYGRKRKSL